MAGSNNIQLIIEFLFKNRDALLKVLAELKEKYNIDIDTSDMDAAFAELEDKSIQIEADGAQAVSEADDVEAEIEKIPDEHKTDIKADGANAMQTITAISVAYQALSQIVDQVKNAISEYVNASNIQEDAEVKLAAALKNTGRYSDEAYESLINYASGIQEITRYGDEAIISAMALAQNIADFGTDELPKVTEAALGLATAYDMDLKTAMMLIARASKGQTQTLTRYGIVLDMTGTKEEQFAELLEQGAKKFKLAEDQAKSGAGALEQYSNLIGDAREKIGDFIKMALVPLMSIFSKIAVKIGDFFRSLTETPLETTIRELKDLGASVEFIQRLKKLQLKTEIIELNSELDKCNDKFETTEEMVTEIEKIEKELSFQIALYADAKADAAENAANERGAAADALNTYTGIAIKSKEELKTLQNKLKDYSTQLELMTSIEIKQSQIESLSEDIHKDTKKTNKELQEILKKISKFDKEIEINLKLMGVDKYFEKLQEQMDSEEELRKEFTQRGYDLNTNIYQRQLDAIDEFYLSKKDKLIEAGLSEEEITKQSELAKSKVREQSERRAVSGASRMFSDLAKVMKSGGKGAFKAYKAMAISQALIDTYAAANAAWKSLSGILFIGPALAAVAVAATIAGGLANVRMIEAQKFPGGGKVSGKKHSQGGTIIEVEDEEIILASGVWKDPILRAMANALNIAGGGIPITGTQPGIKFPGGGKTPGSNLEGIMEEINEGIENLGMLIVENKPNVNITIETIDPEAKIRKDEEIKETMTESNDAITDI